MSRDDESGLHHDYEVWLKDLAAHAPIDQYWHSCAGHGNGDAHLKRQIIDREVVVVNPGAAKGQTSG